ncbi:MAG: glutamate decarboxylase [Clostridia bacterium]|nr:glutamate decarboxylase [Clostridia bacterium]MBO4886433.1 glutamate decarboxylase [Clostridia bacterium]
MKKTAFWVVIHIAHSEEKALEIREKLTQEGFMVDIRAVSGDAGAQVYEILALSSEAREARSMMAELRV